MPSFFKSISGLLTSSVRHLTGTEEEKVQDKNGKIIYCSTAESPYATERRQNIVTVSFDANGGSGSMEVKRIYTGMFTLPECEFTPPTEKVFKGWALTATGEVITSEKIEIRTNTTLYAIWTDKLYKISFEADGGYGPAGSGTMAPQYSPYKVDCPDCTFIPAEGYAFRGWSKSYGGSRIRTWPITVSSDITLYALWEVLRTITFDSNGGTGTQQPIVTMPGLITLPTADELTITPPTGGTFKGWSTDSSGLGEIITQVTVSKDADIYLYAIWEIEDPNYYVTFDRNGGSGEEMPVLKVPKYPFPIFAFPECTYTKEGMYFNGWNQSPTSSAGHVAGDPGNASVATTWFAIWRDVPMFATLSFDPNGGTGTMEPMQMRRHPLSETYMIPHCDFVKEDAEFDHWNTEPDDSGTSYSVLYVFRNGLPDDMTLYAIWKEDRFYNLTLRPGTHAMGTPYDVRLPARTDGPVDQIIFPAPDRNYIRENGPYKFGRWVDSPGSPKGYGEEIPRCISFDDEVWYAEFIDINKKIVRFLPNGGYGDGIDCTTFTTDQGIYLPMCKYTNGDHSFKAWSLTPDGSSGLLGQGAYYNLMEDTAFYAIWWD